MSEYLRFQSETEEKSDDSIEEINTDIHVGAYCYCDNNAFAVITNISSKSDECEIFDLFQKKTKKTHKMESIKLITAHKDLKKAKEMHHKYQMTQHKNIQMTDTIHATAKHKTHITAQHQIEYSSCCQRRFCGKNCMRYALYGICSLLFLLFIGFSTYFISYASPLVQKHTEFESALIKSQCHLSSYDMIKCSYDCYECEESAFCNKCKGPFCSKCSAGSYKYYATATTLCGEDVTLESELNYGDCPQQGNDLLNIGTTYTCYVPLTDGKCQYNNKSVFVFKQTDEAISIGQNYLCMAYIGIVLGAVCLFVIITVKCRKCIKKMPCMN